MQAACEADRKPNRWPTQHAAEHRPDGASVGNRFIDLQAEVGPQNAEQRKHDIAGRAVWKANRDVHQRDEDSRAREQVGDDQIDACLLQQGQGQFDGGESHVHILLVAMA